MPKKTVLAVALLVAIVVTYPIERKATATAPSSGDVNGDGLIDVADSIYLLQYLFSDGADPVALAAGRSQADREILDLFTLTTVTDEHGAEYPTLRISGVNLQIVNGLGATNGNSVDPTAVNPDSTETNGVGNLIVGYNELAPGYGSRRGSHNVVVGSQLAYQRFGGLVVGHRSEIDGVFATVSGGRGRARGLYASVSGGDGVALGDYSSICGGLSGVAGGDGACVSGGDNNEAAGPQTSITGGEGNYAVGYASSITGGNGNVTTAPLSAISAGEQLVTLEIHAWAACSFACP